MSNEFSNHEYNNPLNTSYKSTQAKPPRKKKAIIITSISIFVAIALLVLCLCLFSCSSNGSEYLTADPFDYFTISFYGYDTYGNANMKLNKEAYVSNLMGPAPNINDIQAYASWIDIRDKYCDSLEITCLHTSGLSNGDQLLVTISTNASELQAFQTASKTFTVTGLKELETIDVFDYLDITFDGISGSASLTINKDTSHDALLRCDFDISKQNILSTGDTVTVSVRNAEQVAQNYGYRIAVSSKDYIVPSLPEYLNDPKQIDRKNLSEIIDAFILKEKNQNEENSIFSYSEPIYYKTYLFVKQPDVSFANESILKIYVCYDQYKRGEFWRTIYTSLDYTDLVVQPGETAQLIYEDGSNSTFTDDIENHLANQEGKYFVYEVDVE